MAHILKVKASAVGQMVAHNRRLREPGHYGNENIDPSRTRLNYRIGGVPEVAPVFRDAVVHTPRGRLRRNQVGMVCFLNTLPKDWERTGLPERTFFELAYRYNVGLVPTAIDLGMEVHCDERTRHGHHGFIPTTADGRFNVDQVVPRRIYRTYHKGLQDYIERETGFRVAVLLDDDDPDRLVSGVRQGDLDAAKRSVARELDQTREGAEARAEAAVQFAAALEDNVEAKRAEESELDTRLAEKSAELVGLERDAARLRGKAEAKRAEVSELETRLTGIKADVDEETSRLEWVRRAIERVAKRVEQVIVRVNDALRHRATNLLSERHARLRARMPAVAGPGRADRALHALVQAERWSPPRWRHGSEMFAAARRVPIEDRLGEDGRRLTHRAMCSALHDSTRREQPRGRGRPLDWYDFHHDEDVRTAPAYNSPAPAPAAPAPVYAPER